MCQHHGLPLRLLSCRWNRTLQGLPHHSPVYMQLYGNPTYRLLVHKMPFSDILKSLHLGHLSASTGYFVCFQRGSVYQGGANLQDHLGPDQSIRLTNVTKTALVKENIGIAYVNQHIGLVRLRNKDFASYLYIWLISPNGGRKQLKIAAYGAGKPGLNLQNVKDVTLKLPPLEEQREIIRQVDRLFAFADKLEAHYKSAKNKIDRLGQSVLAKAFRGELVPQDPDDEPAEKLLEHIKEEKMRLKTELKKKRSKDTARTK